MGGGDRHKVYVPAWGMSTVEKNKLGMQGGGICNITGILWETEPCMGWEHMGKNSGAGMCQV